MKPTNMFFATMSSRRRGRVVLIGALAAVMMTVACSTKSRVSTSSPSGGSVRAAAHQTAAAAAANNPTQPKPGWMGHPPAEADQKRASQAPASKLVSYRSRDYGVSFLYPWQYTFRNARTVAGVSAALRPKSDGSAGQFTLARIEIPRGFYPDTDFESGYFTLSFNQELEPQQCESVFGKDAKTDTINGVEFRWVESESGGHGSAEKLRHYTAFTNGTCYELELGVKTSNQDGMARELDPDQVLRRLDGILRTVKIAPVMKEVPVQAEAQE